MTVAFRAANGIGSGTSTTTGFNLPAGNTATDMLLAAYGGKPQTVDVSSGTFLTDYTLLGNKTSGTNANAVDSGSTRCHARYRIHDGSEVAPTGTLSAAPSPRMNGMLCYSRGGDGWDVASTTGADSNITSTARSITADSAIDLQPGDIVVIFVASPSDAASGSGRSLSAAGFTFTAPTNRFATSGTTSGNDGNMVACEATVLTGSGSATLTYADTVTTNTSSEAAAVFVRLRETVTPSTVVDYWGMRA